MAFNFKSSQEFVEALKTDTSLQNEMKADPSGAMDKVKIAGEIPDTRIYRLVVASLISTVILIVTGLLLMALFDKAANNQNILTIFTAVASTAIGALAGVLMPVQRKN